MVIGYGSQGTVKCAQGTHIWCPVSILIGDFLVAQMVKNLPAVQEAWVRSLGQDDSLEEEMATPHSSLLAWRIPRTEEPGRAAVHGGLRD